MHNLGFRFAFFSADPQVLQSLTSHGWLGLIHSVLMVLFLSRVVVAYTIRLEILAPKKKLTINSIAETVPVEHPSHRFTSHRQRRAVQLWTSAY